MKVSTGFAKAEQVGSKVGRGFPIFCFRKTKVVFIYSDGYNLYCHILHCMPMYRLNFFWNRILTVPAKILLVSGTLHLGSLFITSVISSCAIRKILLLSLPVGGGGNAVFGKGKASHLFCPVLLLSDPMACALKFPFIIIFLLYS